MRRSRQTKGKYCAKVRKFLGRLKKRGGKKDYGGSITKSWRIIFTGFLKRKRVRAYRAVSPHPKARTGPGGEGRWKRIKTMIGGKSRETRKRTSEEGNLHSRMPDYCLSESRQ